MMKVVSGHGTRPVTKASTLPSVVACTCSCACQARYNSQSPIAMISVALAISKVGGAAATANGATDNDKAGENENDRRTDMREHQNGARSNTSEITRRAPEII